MSEPNAEQLADWWLSGQLLAKPEDLLKSLLEHHRSVMKRHVPKSWLEDEQRDHRKTKEELDGAREALELNAPLILEVAVASPRIRCGNVRWIGVSLIVLLAYAISDGHIRFHRHPKANGTD